jgi:hypothetical protein
MIGAIIIGGAILLGSVMLFGPIGLVFAVLGVVCFGWLFEKGGWTTISEEDKEHARKLWGKE